jgi:hypothetical protein
VPIANNWAISSSSAAVQSSASPLPAMSWWVFGSSPSLEDILKDFRAFTFLYHLNPDICIKVKAAGDILASCAIQHEMHAEQGIDLVMLAMLRGIGMRFSLAGGWSEELEPKFRFTVSIVVSSMESLSVSSEKFEFSSIEGAL